jgi:hypothetical protein
MSPLDIFPTLVSPVALQILKAESVFHSSGEKKSSENPPRQNDN